MYHLPERASYPACRDQRQWASVEMSSANGFTSVPFTSCATVGPSVIYFVFLRSALVPPAIPRVSVDARHISATNSGTPARKGLFSIAETPRHRGTVATGRAYEY